MTYGVHTDDTDTEVNMIYDHLTTDAYMTDKNETTIMDNNEAYGTAIDGIGIDTMERNIAYGAILSQDDSSAWGF